MPLVPCGQLQELDRPWRVQRVPSLRPRGRRQQRLLLSGSRPPLKSEKMPGCLRFTSSLDNPRRLRLPGNIAPPPYRENCPPSSSPRSASLSACVSPGLRVPSDSLLSPTPHPGCACRVGTLCIHMQVARWFRSWLGASRKRTLTHSRVSHGERNHRIHECHAMHSCIRWTSPVEKGGARGCMLD